MLKKKRGRLALIVKIVRLKFIYSEKATIFCEISMVDLSYVATVKSTLEILQNFVAFLEYMNFIGVLIDYVVLNYLSTNNVSM